MLIKVNPWFEFDEKFIYFVQLTRPGTEHAKPFMSVVRGSFFFFFFHTCLPEVVFLGQISSV